MEIPSPILHVWRERAISRPPQVAYVLMNRHRLRVVRAQPLERLAEYRLPFSVFPCLLLEEPALLRALDPRAAAPCIGVFGQYTMRIDAANTSAISAGGLISQPTRQPVAVNSLPAVPTVIVRSHLPGSVAKRTCSVS